MKDDYEYTEYDSGVQLGLLKVAIPIAAIIGGVLWYLFTH